MQNNSQLNYAICQQHQKKISYINISKECAFDKRTLCSECMLSGQIIKLNKLESILKDGLQKQEQKNRQYKEVFDRVKDNYLESINQLSNNFDKLLTQQQPEIISKFLTTTLNQSQYEILADYLSESLIITENSYQLNSDPMNQELIKECINQFEKQQHQIQSLASSYYKPQQFQKLHIKKIIQLQGHTKEISSVKFNNSMTQLISAQLGGDLLVWDCQNFNRIQLLEGHTAAVRDICFTQSDQQMVTVSEDHSMRIWGLRENTWILHQKLQCHNKEVIQVRLNHLETILVTCSNDKTIKFYQQNNHKLWEPYQTLNDHNNPVRAIAFNRNSQLLASGSGDKQIKLWQTTSGIWTLKQTILGHTDCVHCLQFCQNSNILVSAGQDNKIFFWNQDNENQYKVIKKLEGHTQRIFSLQFNDASNILISGAADKTIKIWDNQKDWECIQTIQENGRIYSMSLCKQLLAVANCTKELPIYEIELN